MTADVAVQDVDARVGAPRLNKQKRCATLVTDKHAVVCNYYHFMFYMTDNMWARSRLIYRRNHH